MPSHLATPRPQTKVTREDWVKMGLKMFINEGVEQTNILTLAKRLNVSRASFYWYFENKEQLLEEILTIWSQKNTYSIIEQAHKDANDIVESVANVFGCWMDIESFDPRLDAAVRAWAHQDKTVSLKVDSEDDLRLTALKEMFVRHQYPDDEAFIRARVLYFMQIGYYALNIQESFETRFSYFKHYIIAFTGVTPTDAQIKLARKITYSGAQDNRDDFI